MLSTQELLQTQRASTWGVVVMKLQIQERARRRRSASRGSKPRAVPPQVQVSWAWPFRSLLRQALWMLAVTVLVAVVGGGGKEISGLRGSISVESDTGGKEEEAKVCED